MKLLFETALSVFVCYSMCIGSAAIGAVLGLRLRRQEIKTLREINKKMEEAQKLQNDNYTHLMKLYNDVCKQLDSARGRYN
jgi:hypothetical protein